MIGFKPLFISCATVILAGCGGGGSDDSLPNSNSNRYLSEAAKSEAFSESVQILESGAQLVNLVEITLSKLVSGGELSSEQTVVNCGNGGVIDGEITGDEIEKGDAVEGAEFEIDISQCDHDYFGGEIGITVEARLDVSVASAEGDEVMLDVAIYELSLNHADAEGAISWAGDVSMQIDLSGGNNEVWQNGTLDVTYEGSELAVSSLHLKRAYTEESDYEVNMGLSYTRGASGASVTLEDVTLTGPWGEYPDVAGMKFALDDKRFRVSITSSSYFSSLFSLADEESFGEPRRWMAFIQGPLFVHIQDAAVSPEEIVGSFESYSSGGLYLSTRYEFLEDGTYTKRSYYTSYHSSGTTGNAGATYPPGGDINYYSGTYKVEGNHITLTQTTTISCVYGEWIGQYSRPLVWEIDVFSPDGEGYYFVFENSSSSDEEYFTSNDSNGEVVDGEQCNR